MFNTASQTIEIQIGIRAQPEYTSQSPALPSLWMIGARAIASNERSFPRALLRNRGSVRVSQHVRRNWPFGPLDRRVSRPIPAHMCLINKAFQGSRQRTLTVVATLCNWTFWSLKISSIWIETVWMVPSSGVGSFGAPHPFSQRSALGGPAHP